jgi:hypothetical protein
MQLSLGPTPGSQSDGKLVHPSTLNLVIWKVQERKLRFSVSQENSMFKDYYFLYHVYILHLSSMSIILISYTYYHRTTANKQTTRVIVADL